MIKSVLKRYMEGKRLSDTDLKILLNSKGDDREAIFEVARNVRNKYFGNEIFLYGFVYFSTYCKNNCNFCFYRMNNTFPPRYRKSEEEIINTAVRLAESGVHLIDLTMGEDPYYHAHFYKLTDIVKRVKQETGLPVMVSPGVVDKAGILQLAEAGADWYALYQETHSEELFRKLRIGQDYNERMECKKIAKQYGMLIEEGLLTGVGDTVEERIHSLRVMQGMGTSQVRTMTFVPQKGTPMEDIVQHDESDELLNIAVMRLLFPDELIPASLDVDGLDGLRTRLMAGANVITSIIPPLEGYAGVAQAEHDINDGNRTVDGVRGTVNECGLVIADAQDYKNWVSRRKQHECVSNWM